jgi:hypothetical protein
MSETALKTYKGNCHCGAFRFEISIPEIKNVIACGCSLCSKKGYLWALPIAGGIEVTKGDDVLSSYKFGSGIREHKVNENTVQRGVKCAELMVD